MNVLLASILGGLLAVVTALSIAGGFYMSTSVHETSLSVALTASTVLSLGGYLIGLIVLLFLRRFSVPADYTNAGTILLGPLCPLLLSIASTRQAQVLTSILPWPITFLLAIAISTALAMALPLVIRLVRR